MAIVIRYNDVDVFTGLGYLPLVSRTIDSIYVNGRIALIDKITLRGKLKRQVCIDSFAATKSLADQLIDKFTPNFKKFEIFEYTPNSDTIATESLDDLSTEDLDYLTAELFQSGYNLIYRTNYAIIRSISFDENRWVDLIPYTVEIESYRDGFVDTWGVLDPKLDYSFKEEVNGICEVTVDCGARGINNGIQAISNAKAFVAANAVWDGTQASAYFLPEISGLTFYERNRQETVNRLTGEVSLSITYSCDKNSKGSLSVLDYTREISVSQDGTTEVTINGSASSSRGSDDYSSVIATDIKNKDWYSIAAELYAIYDSAGSLGTTPIDFSLRRKVSENVIEFSIKYSNQIDAGAYLIDETTISKDLIKSITCISVTATIKANGGCKNKRWLDVTNYYNSFNFENFVAQKWSKWGSGRRLNYNANSKGYSENEFAGEISLTATYCDNNSDDCGCIKDFQYSMSFQPSLPSYVAAPTLNGLGCYYIEDLNAYKRAGFSIQGNARSSFCCSFKQTAYEIKARINQIMNRYFAGSNKILESSSVTEDQNSRVINFSSSWSAEQTNIIPSNLL